MSAVEMFTTITNGLTRIPTSMPCVEKTSEYKVFEGNRFKVFVSENCNYTFDKLTGDMELFGKTRDEEPGRFPAPNILDLEATTICSGVDGKVCPFCFPEKTKVLMADSSYKDIAAIRPGDVVMSKDMKTGSVHQNTVKETYTRFTEEMLVVIELENGSVIKATPNHPFYVKGYGWKPAAELTDSDEVELFEEVCNRTVKNNL